MKNLASRPNGEWVRLAVRHTGRSQETIGGKGNRRFRSFGLVFVQVFTEVGERMKAGGLYSPGNRRHVFDVDVPDERSPGRRPDV